MISGAIIYADSRDDLGRVKSDFESLRSRHDNSTSRLDSYLDGSVKLRSFDKDQLAELVTQMCKLDIEEDNDEADRSSSIRPSGGDQYQLTPRFSEPIWMSPSS